MFLWSQVRFLVEEGKADVGSKDRWGKTALEEAHRVGAAPVIEYLEHVQNRLQQRSQSK